MLSFGANERVTKIEAWRNNIDFLWYRLKLTLNSGATQEYNPAYTGIDTIHTFEIPAGQEFTGFSVNGALSGCEISDLLVVTRAAVCTVSWDSSQVTGHNQVVLTDATTTKTFTASHMYCGSSL